MHWQIQGKPGTRPYPLILILFMQLLAKNLQNNRLAHPLWELAHNSGSATDTIEEIRDSSGMQCGLEIVGSFVITNLVNCCTLVFALSLIALSLE